MALEVQPSAATSIQATRLSSAHPADTTAARRRSPTIWSAFARDRVALGAAGYLLALTLIAVFGPFVEAYPFDRQDLNATFQSPSTAHPLGTDNLGRDLLVRLIHGTRISLFIGFTAQAAEVALGLLLGSFAAYYGGRFDNAVMRVADILLAFPPLLLAILLTGILGPSIPNIILAIVVSGWPAMARTVRAEVIVLKTREFAEAARAIGATDWRLVAHHLAPNTLHIVAVRATLGVGLVIMVEATLSFLGIGVQPPTPSLGGMISEAFKMLRSQPMLLILPSVVLSSIVLAFNFFGEGLADSMNPWTRKA